MAQQQQESGSNPQDLSDQAESPPPADNPDQSQDSPDQGAEPQKAAGSPRSRSLSKEELRQHHLQRALGAVKTGGEDEGGDDPSEDESDASEDVGAPDDAKGLAALKAAWVAGDTVSISKTLGIPDKFAKVKNFGQLRKATAKAAEEFEKQTADLDKYRKKADKQMEMADQVREQFAPVAEGIAKAQAGDWRGFNKHFESTYGVPFAKAAREIWNATKDGQSTADLRAELAEVKKLLTDRGESAGGKVGAKPAKAEAPATGGSDESRAEFDSKLTKHPMHQLDDKLADEAFAVYSDSWDDDLEEHSMTPRQAADQVTRAARERAARILGTKLPSDKPKPVPVETEYRNMSKEDKRKFALKRALRDRERDERSRALR